MKKGRREERKEVKGRRRVKGRRKVEVIIETFLEVSSEVSKLFIDKSRIRRGL